MNLLNMGWGYYNYPSPLDLILVMGVTLIIEMLLVTVYEAWKKQPFGDCISLLVVIAFANIITGIMGYLLAFT